MPTTATKLMTAEDLLALGPDFHGELVRGRIIEMAPASWGHGDKASRVDRIVGQFVDDHDLGTVFGAETGFFLARDPDVVRAPDCAFVRASRIPKDSDGTGFFPGAPDLAVEILSPGDKQTDIEEKIDDYLNAGCIAVWIINPKRKSLTIHRGGQNPLVFRESDTLDAGEPLPGLVVPVRQLFA